jgi:hypothetical protein
MNQTREPDAIIATWLDDGPIDLPDETRRAIVVGLRTQPRARRMAILGGSSMSPINRLVAAAAIVLAVGGLSAFVLSNRAGGPGGIANPSAAPSAVPSSSQSATASFNTAGWVKFSSARYGYSISIPADWTAQQSDRQWSLAVDQKDWLTTAADALIGPGGPGIGSRGPRFTVFAVDLPAGMSSDAWIAQYFGSDAKGSPDPCTNRPVDLGTKTVDGHPAAIWTEVSTADCGGTAAFVFVNNRAYAFSIWLDGQEPMFEALLSTVTFQP